MSTRNFILDEFKSLKCIKDYQRLEEYVDYCLSKQLPDKIKHQSSSHHILPRAKMLPFGKYADFNKNSWNKAELYYYDHYIAHYLLYLAIDHYSVVFAFCAMHNKDINKNIKHDLISEKEFTSIFLERNKKISERRKEMIMVDGSHISRAAHSTRTRNLSVETRTRMSEAMKGNNNIVHKEGVVTSIREKKKNTLMDGKNMDTISAERAATTMKKKFIDDEGKVSSIYQKNAEKLSKYLNKEIQLADGSTSTLAKIKARKKGDKTIQKGNFYRVLNFFDSNYQKILPAIEVRRLSPGLDKKTRDNFLGKSKFGITALTRKNKSHLIGLYVEKLD